MRYLLVAPDLGFLPSGKIAAGGLQNLARSTTRALASSPSLTKLSIWSQVDAPSTNDLIKRMVSFHAHPNLDLDIRGFGRAKGAFSRAIVWANLFSHFDRVMYLLINQAVLANVPRHCKYVVWEIGREMFQPLPWHKQRVLRQADSLLSISFNTADQAQRHNPNLSPAKVIHLCVEPPLFAPCSDLDPIATENSDSATAVPAVFILSRIVDGSLDKGHQELITGWPLVVSACPQAQLWIGGDGNGQAVLRKQVSSLPPHVAKQVRFLGFLEDAELHACFQRCRVFAMPSRKEGFGLVFVEAARYGKPCIGSVHDSVKEIVLHNKTGLLVEQEPRAIAQACIKLLSDDDLAKRLGEAGRQRYLEYFRYHHFRARLLTAVGLEL